MKKYSCALLMMIVGLANIYAKPVPLTSAKRVAESFYKQNAKAEFVSSTLVYTEMTTAGSPLCFAFTINSKDGFVIVSADDAIKPIIGYSTEGGFVVPKANTTIGYWLKEQSKAINKIRSLGIVADEKVNNEWLKYSTDNEANLRLANSNNSVANIVSPLTQTTWNQSPYYNALCPDSSVTGCVATAMAQIMKFWNYPAQGTGSSSYCDCTAGGYQENYGTLSANYGATTYSWSAMPLNVISPNLAVATLMYHCGVSVDMGYSPTESYAYVLTADQPICSQSAYINYFKYNPYTLQGLYRASYVDSLWISVLENELVAGRPIQYLAQDPVNGGHSWVCDGFDIHNNFHMNWGWGGYDNGYYAINNLNTGYYDFSADHEVLIGIVPMSITTNQAGTPAITVASNCSDTLVNATVTLENYGSNVLTSCLINYQLDNGTIQTYSWSGSLTSGQSINVTLPGFIAAVGEHTLTCYSSSPNDSIGSSFYNSQSSTTFGIASGANLPVIEGFETSTCPSGTLPNSTWNISHTLTGGADFIITSAAAATGSKSCMLNNLSNVGGNNSILETSSSYDMTTLTNPLLTFQAAYQQRATTNADKLQIFTSTDCGNSWISRKVITSTTLASLAGGISSSPYLPTPSQFTTYTVPISAVSSNQNVMFRWEFIADPTSPGNNLYIDNINIIDAAEAGVQTIETTINLNIYPNPSQGKINIEFNLLEQHSISVNITDLLGRIIEAIPSKFYQSGNSILVIDNIYQVGVYLVSIGIDEKSITKKIIIH